MQGLILSFLELFANVKEVQLTTRHQDADQGSVICAKALWRKPKRINAAVSPRPRRAFLLMLHFSNTKGYSESFRPESHFVSRNQEEGFRKMIFRCCLYEFANDLLKKVL